MVYGIWHMAYQRTPMKKTTLYLSESMQRELKDAARRTGKSEALVIREALAAYLVKQGRMRPRSLGIVEDGTLPAEEAKAWVRGEWSRRGASGQEPPEASS